MLADERQSLIVEEVNHRGTVSTADLIDQFGVSPITIRRDLTDLADRGLIAKVHGGARSLQASNNPSLEIKALTNRRAKEAIAHATTKLVKDGESLMLSAGSTCAMVAHSLAQTRHNLTVITDCAPIADEFRWAETAGIYLTGGKRAPNDALVGPLAIAAIERLNAKTLITSVHAADAETLTTPSIEEGEVLRAMMRACERVVVVFDHSKWGVRALSTVTGWESVDTAVVDSEMPPGAISQLKELVREVVIAQ